jgi:hypothetical protein
MAFGKVAPCPSLHFAKITLHFPKLQGERGSPFGFRLWGLQDSDGLIWPRCHGGRKWADYGPYLLGQGSTVQSDRARGSRHARASRTCWQTHVSPRRYSSAIRDDETRGALSAGASWGRSRTPRRAGSVAGLLTGSWLPANVMKSWLSVSLGTRHLVPIAAIKYINSLDAEMGRRANVGPRGWRIHNCAAISICATNPDRVRHGPPRPDCPNPSISARIWEFAMDRTPLSPQQLAREKKRTTVI